MPTYQYRCTACGHDLDVVQSFSDAALTECPACTGRLRKVFGSVGVVFKGSGFYKTDSRSGSSSGVPAARSKESTTSSGDSPAPSGASASSGDGASSGSAGSASSSSSSSDSGSSGARTGAASSTAAA